MTDGVFWAGSLNLKGALRTHPHVGPRIAPPSLGGMSSAITRSEELKTGEHLQGIASWGSSPVVDRCVKLGVGSITLVPAALKPRIHQQSGMESSDRNWHPQEIATPRKICR